MTIPVRTHPRPAVALIVTAQEWVSLSVETLFAPRGYAVIRAFTGAQTLQRAQEHPPDVLLIDRDLRDMPGTHLCRELLAQGSVFGTTPMVLFSTGPWPREVRLEALRAGAWDVCSLPMDGEELFLRVNTWVNAKLTADEGREQSLLDAGTGLYNANGLLRRIIELGAGASRNSRPLACVVIAAVPEAPALPTDTVARTGLAWSTSFAHRLRTVGRTSDTFGRLTESEFVVVAPDTDMSGVLGLARRLQLAMESSAADPAHPLQLRFGCYAVSNFRDAAIPPTEMLIRAAQAVRTAGANHDSIQYFHPSVDSLN